MSCIKKCLGAEEDSAVGDALDDGLEWVFDSAAKFIRAEALVHGITVPDTLEGKLYRYGVKNGVLPVRDPEVPLFDIFEPRESLDVSISKKRPRDFSVLDPKQRKK